MVLGLQKGVKLVEKRCCFLLNAGSHPFVLDPDGAAAKMHVRDDQRMLHVADDPALESNEDKLMYTA